jgi:hypothetical protein
MVRCALPVGLEIVRTAGPLDADTLPGALRRAHLIVERTLGVLRVLGGSVVFAIETTPPVSVRVHAGDEQPIPPGVPHLVRVDEPCGSPSTSSSDPTRRAGRRSQAERAGTNPGDIPGSGALAPDAPGAVARRFNRIAWPAFGVLVATGIWNIVDLSPDWDSDEGRTVTVNIAVVAASGLTALLHARARRHAG